MKKILVSGLLNIETCVNVSSFPIEYSPIDYRFFGVNSAVSGVCTNIAFALKTLQNEPCVLSLLGDDLNAEIIRNEFEKRNIKTDYILNGITKTPSSVVLYDENGRRKIYCDLTDIQENVYPVSVATSALKECDIAVLCNINFNRPLLDEAKRLNKTIATDVHVFSNLDDEYNKDFLLNSDIVFLSDEAIQNDKITFLRSLKEKYNVKIAVLGCGADGAIMYVRDEDLFYKVGCVKNDNIVNTVGAGDALFSSFIHFYSKGYKPIECLKYAQTFASAKISADGASKGFITEEMTEKNCKKYSFDIEIIK